MEVGWGERHVKSGRADSFLFINFLQHHNLHLQIDIMVTRCAGTLEPAL